nr:hypothetical protein [Jiangella endophytica]
MTWNVPLNAAPGSTSERSRGSRVSSRLSFSWAPSGGFPGAVPSSPANVDGAQPASTCPAPTDLAPPSRDVNTTSPPSASMAVTVALVTMTAPAATAASRSAPLTAPMPPTGTSQSPVPLPMTW